MTVPEIHGAEPAAAEPFGDAEASGEVDAVDEAEARVQLNW